MPRPSEFPFQNCFDGYEHNTGSPDLGRLWLFSSREAGCGEITRCLASASIYMRRSLQCSDVRTPKMLTADTTNRYRTSNQVPDPVNPARRNPEPPG